MHSSYHIRGHSFHALTWIFDWRGSLSPNTHMSAGLRRFNPFRSFAQNHDISNASSTSWRSLTNKNTACGAGKGGVGEKQLWKMISQFTPVTDRRIHKWRDILKFSCLLVTTSLQIVRIWDNIRSPCARNVSRYNDGGSNVDRQQIAGCPSRCGLGDETLWGMVKLEEVNNDFNDRVLNLPCPRDVVNNYLRLFNIWYIVVDTPTMPREAIFRVESESHSPGMPRWRDQHDRILPRYEAASAICRRCMTIHRK